MALSRMLTRVVGFLRAGYPKGVPAQDYIPLLALLRRRLSDDEVIAVATELMADGGMPVDGTDVRVAITKLTDEMPSQKTPSGLSDDWPQSAGRSTTPSEIRGRRRR